MSVVAYCPKTTLRPQGVIIEKASGWERLTRPEALHKGITEEALGKAPGSSEEHRERVERLKQALEERFDTLKDKDFNSINLDILDINTEFPVSPPADVHPGVPGADSADDAWLSPFERTMRMAEGDYQNVVEKVLKRARELWKDDFAAADKRVDDIVKEFHNGEFIDLRGSDLANAKLQGMNCARWRMEGTNLESALLDGANMFRARMIGVTLFQASLRSACMNEAHMMATECDKAHFEGAILDKVRLKEAKNLEDAFWNIVKVPKFQRASSQTNMSLLLLLRALTAGDEDEGDAEEEEEEEDKNLCDLDEEERKQHDEEPASRRASFFEPAPGARTASQASLSRPNRQGLSRGYTQMSTTQDINEGDPAPAGGEEDLELGDCDTDPFSTAPEQHGLSSCGSLCGVDQALLKRRESVVVGLNELTAKLMQIPPGDDLQEHEEACKEYLKQVQTEAPEHAPDLLKTVLEKASQKILENYMTNQENTPLNEQATTGTVGDILKGHRNRLYNAMKADPPAGHHRAKSLLLLLQAQKALSSSPMKPALAKEFIRLQTKENTAAFMHAELNARTNLSMVGAKGIMIKCLFMQMPTLIAAEKELERLKSNLETLPQQVNTMTWDEVTDNWTVFLHIVEAVRQDRSIVIVQNVFKDKDLALCIGMAQQLRDIDRPDEPPYGLLTKLKEAQMIIKKNLNHFVIAIDNEIMKINMIRRYKMNMIGAMSSVFLSSLIAGGNMFGNWYLHQHLFKDTHP